MHYTDYALDVGKSALSAVDTQLTAPESVRVSVRPISPIAVEPRDESFEKETHRSRKERLSLWRMVLYSSLITPRHRKFEAFYKYEPILILF